MSDNVFFELLLLSLQSELNTVENIGGIINITTKAGTSLLIVQLDHQREVLHSLNYTLFHGHLHTFDIILLSEDIFQLQLNWMSQCLKTDQLSCDWREKERRRKSWNEWRWPFRRRFWSLGLSPFYHRFQTGGERELSLPKNSVATASPSRWIVHKFG